MLERLDGREDGGLGGGWQCGKATHGVTGGVGLGPVAEVVEGHVEGVGDGAHAEDGRRVVARFQLLDGGVAANADAGRELTLR